MGVRSSVGSKLKKDPKQMRQEQKNWCVESWYLVIEPAAKRPYLQGMMTIYESK